METKWKRIHRPNKGKSIMAFPENYVVIDIETTGLDFTKDNIIQLSGIRYQNGKEIDTYDALINPHQKLDPYIIELTGITDDMVKNGKEIKEALIEFHNFIKEDILVGYNIENFDSNFIYDKMHEYTDYEFSNDYIDVLIMARLLHPDLHQFRQSDMALFYHIDNDGAHRSLFDCEVCNKIFIRLQNEVHNKEHFIERYQMRKQMLRKKYHW